MIYVCGDTHGMIDMDKLTDFFCSEVQKRSLTKDDYVIILGDVGVCWDGGEEDAQIRETLSSLPVTVLFIDGNHENFTLLNAYEAEIWKGGMVHRVAPDIIHLMRGYVYEIEGKSFFVMGGAYSRDRIYRREGVGWWPEEIPSGQELSRGRNAIEQNGCKVDYVLSHSAPKSVAISMGRDLWEAEEELQNFFDWVASHAEFKEWYFGHYHWDWDAGKFHCLMDRVIDLPD